MFDELVVGKMRLEATKIGLDRSLYVRSEGDFSDASHAQIRQLARKLAHLILKQDQGATLMDTRFTERHTTDLSQFSVHADEMAKVLGHHHRVGWLFHDEPGPAEAMCFGAAALNKTGRLRSAAFSGWDAMMSYMREPGLMDPARFNRYPRRGTETRPSSRIIGSQTCRPTLATPSRPQV